MTRTRPAGLLLAVAVLASPAAAPAQVAYPPRPDRYDTHVRYRIRADRDERVRQYRAMTAFFDKLGFVPAQREDADLEMFDPTAERTHGTIPSGAADRLLEDPRVLTVLFAPAGWAAPDDPAKPVQVRLALSVGLAPPQQHELHAQLTRHLGLLGFREAVGYDHAGYTRLRGALPAGELFTLLRDVRSQPTGWFAPAVPPEELPAPLRTMLPIRLIEVLPDPPAGETPLPPTAPFGKLTADAAAAVADPALQGKPIRVDAILESAPGLAWRDVRLHLASAGIGASVEGLVGVVATVRLQKPADIERLAALPQVRSVRLPRAGVEAGRLADGGKPLANATADARLSDLHAKGYTGQGVRIAVIGAGFPNPPAGANLVDLTAELDPELTPAPATNGIGSAVAALAAGAAPGASITLVRIDPTAFHQLMTVARAASGEPVYSDAMISRSYELSRRSEELAARRTAVSDEYRRAFADLSDEPEPAKRREAARAAFDRLIADEQVLRGAIERFTRLKAGLDGLVGTLVVVNTLVWDVGVPQDGLSALSRLLEERYTPRPGRSALKASRQPPVPVWVQPASPAVGQVWAGPYLDGDGNGVLEFAPAAAPLPAGRWTRELNFLGTASGETLPAGAKLRLTVQWREALITEGASPPDPAVPLVIRVFRQVDPAGKTVASDELVEVARSTAAPVRLLQTAGSSAYEQSLDFVAPAEGVYAVRVEAAAVFSDPIPGQRRGGEIYPRLVVSSLDPAGQRPVWKTFATRAAGVGVPGDSIAALAVGTLAGDTLTGMGPGVTLRTKPEVLAPGAIAGVDGPAAAAGFMAGAAASLVSAGVRPTDLERTTGLPVGGPLVLPAEWLRLVPSRARSISPNMMGD
ncbi:MAG: hypothetical protein U0871_03685 [Gemmataceae bacterium]